MSETMAYVARKPCGCAVGAAVDEPQYAKDNAKEIARWVRAGLTIDRATVERVRSDPSFLRCEHGA